MRRDSWISIPLACFTQIRSIMCKSRQKSRTSLKATTLQLRLSPNQKALLARAAQLRQTSLSSFVLEFAHQAAQHVLAEQVDIVMSAADWAAFTKALDAPPRSIPELKKLLTQTSVFDGNLVQEAEKLE